MADSGSWIDTLKVHFGDCFDNIYWWIRYTLFWNPIKRDDYWASVIYSIKMIGLHVWNGFNDASQWAIDWASGFITDLLRTAGLIWDSITSLWGRFGAAILDGMWTVVTWVRATSNNILEWAKQRYDGVRQWAVEAWDWVKNKGGLVWDWILDSGAAIWEWIREKGGSVWEWVRNKGGNVWDWIVKTGAAIESWWNKYWRFYSELFDTFANQLWSFLEDPERFILDYVVDGLEYVLWWAVTRFW